MTQVPPFLTAPQVAQRLTEAGLPVSEETVRQWAKSGRLASVKLPNGRHRFRPEVVDAIVNGETAADVA
jgi:predicted site-specific integrase-resolvase